MSPAELRVPLSALPGFDPVGLAVLATDGGDRNAIVVDEDLVYDRWTVCIGGGGLWDIWTRHILLDLADASTRDRVARYIAERVRLEAGSTAPSWSWWGGLAWELAAPIGRRRWSPEGKWCAAVPALADLDPTDGTRVPDGSRLVDAVALARVAVHVGAR